MAVASKTCFLLDNVVNGLYTAGMAEKREDPAMAKVRALFQESRLTLHDLGIKMGCPPETARQSTFQFMKTADPHISMLRRFAVAMGISVEELVGERANKRPKRASDNSGKKGEQ